MTDIRTKIMARAASALSRKGATGHGEYYALIYIMLICIEYNKYFNPSPTLGSGESFRPRDGMPWAYTSYLYSEQQGDTAIAHHRRVLRC
jgi:hypothetical protein